MTTINTTNNPTLAQWTDTVRGCVRAVALANHEFTVETIRPLIPKVAKEPRPLYNILRDLEKEGMIKATTSKAWSKTTRKYVMIWESFIAKESAIKEAHSSLNIAAPNIPTEQPSVPVNRIPVPKNSPSRISEQIIGMEGAMFSGDGDSMALDDEWNVLPSDEEIDEILARMGERDDELAEIDSNVVEEFIHYLCQEGYVIAQENPSTRFHRAYTPASIEQLDQIVEGFCEAQGLYYGD